MGIPGINNYSDNNCKENKASREKSGKHLWTFILSDKNNEAPEKHSAQIRLLTSYCW